MKSRIFKTLAVSALVTNLPAANSALGNNYYFSTSTSGSGNGTLANPYSNLSSLNNLILNAGDNVYLRGGDTFAGNVYLDPLDGGTAANPVTLSTYGTGRATINAGSSNDAIFAYNNGGFSISNLNLVGNGYTKNTTNGIDFYNDLAGNVKKNYVRIDNVTASGFGGSGVVMGGFNGSSGYNDVRITNVVAHDNGKCGVQTYGSTFTPASPNYALTNVYVGHVQAYNNFGLATDPNPTGSGVVLGSVNGGTIERSVAHDNGINNVNTAGPAGIWTYNSTGVVIQYNESYHNRTSGGDGDGYDIDINTKNCVLQFNYSHDNDGAGYLVFSDNGRTNTGNVVRFNISQNDSRKLAYGGIMIAGSAVNGLEVYNNTVYLDKNLVNASAAAIAVQNINGAPTNVHLRNNILYSANGATTLNVVSGGGLLAQGNDYFAAGSQSVLILYGGIAKNSLAEFRLAGQESINGAATGLNVDPGLTAAGAGGTIGDADQLASLSAYRLLSLSALRDAGLDIKTLFGVDPGLSDFYGILIPRNNGFDVGAAEFSLVPEPTGLTIGGGLAILMTRRRRGGRSTG